MKRLWISVAVVVIIFLIGITITVNAGQAELPPRFYSFEAPGGAICVYNLINGETDAEDVVVLDCYCPCGTSECDQDVPETKVPEDTPTPPPEPTPPDAEKCNRGIGNNSEGCDPGNSSGQGQGAGRDAGEDRDEHKKDK